MSRKDYNREYMRKRRAGKPTALDNGLSHLIEELDWKLIPDHQGYAASKCGQILSLKRIVSRNNGRPHTVPSLVLKQNPDTKGYMQVGLYVNKRKKMRQVHRLIHLAWQGEIPKDKVVDHIDANRLNNHADNLQLLSQQENTLKGWADVKKVAYQAGYEQALKDVRSI